MRDRIYAGDLDIATLETSVNALRLRASFAILERIDDIAFPIPAGEVIAVVQWPKGRLFAPGFELRWEQIGNVYRTILATDDGSTPPAGLTEEDILLPGEAAKDEKYYLWNESNPRLGHTLEYRCIPGKGNVKLAVREYRDDHGRLAFWRFVAMERER